MDVDAPDPNVLIDLLNQVSYIRSWSSEGRNEQSCLKAEVAFLAFS